ncbi:class I SAM-dependent methyltransferase [Christiangramia portivictoriae]|uniref:class I SAM-dependent methyltransferase n=1 Tax=Christiangramia portivictoriae TaxID=326069 RepID=UPI0003FE8786|nr:class I SAM-dependent methyltransferase [Christiangramia portivictoriae]
MKDSEDLKEVNIRQKEFYNSKKKNRITKLWYALRNGALQDARKNLGLERQIKGLHLSWFGDLSNKKVLDLGCYAGNSLSMHLAANAKEYVAIDLSELGISRLRRKLDQLPSKNTKALTIDFFSDEFTDANFDLIYAFGVLHHFRNTEKLIERLKEKLTKNGEIISYDPLKTSFPIKIARGIYRPFQSDKDWEWPFSRDTYESYNKHFRIKDRRAILGRAKYFFLIKLLPFSNLKKDKILRKWHKSDWDKSRTDDAKMFGCMHLTLWMQTR